MGGTQNEACEGILRNAGYSNAWILDWTDQTEVGFVVPAEELD
jgi:hypothetical protein